MTLECAGHTAKNKIVRFTIEEDYSSVTLNRWKITLNGDGEGEGGIVSYEFYSVPINRVTGSVDGRPKYIGGNSKNINTNEDYNVSTSSIVVTGL